MSIEITNNGMNIKDVIITDPDTVGYYRSLDSDEVRLETCKIAIKIGTTMVERANVSSQMDYVKSYVGDIMSHSESQAKAITDAAEAIISKKFDPDDKDSAIAAVKEMIEQTLAPTRAAADYVNQQQKNLEKALDPANSDGHSGKFAQLYMGIEKNILGMFDRDSKTSIPSWIENELGEALVNKVAELTTKANVATHEKIDSLKEEIIKTQSAQEAVDEANEKSPVKGFSFEDEVLVRLESMAKVTGDVVSNTANEIGLVTASKKGDFIVDVNGFEDQRIVIECKNRKMESFKSVFDGAEKSLRNRNASFMVYMTKDRDQLQNQVAGWKLFRERNLIITSSDMLEVAVEIAKSEMALSNASIDGIDVSAIDGQLELIVKHVNSSNSIVSNISNIEKSAEKLRELHNSGKKLINDAVSVIRDVIAQATEKAA